MNVSAQITAEIQPSARCCHGKSLLHRSFLAVDIVLEIVLSVQDLVVFVPLGESEFHGRLLQLFNLRHSKKQRKHCFSPNV